jgi:glycosyltransferase involved in cell wall biosynthesis
MSDPQDPRHCWPAGSVSLAVTGASGTPQQPRAFSRRLHIAMVAPPYFGVPPIAYGGVEAVVADLVDALVGRGHEVTLIGAGRHATRAQRFIATYETGPAGQLGELMPELVHAARVASILSRLSVDVIHDHTVAGPLASIGRRVPAVVTAHNSVTGERGDFYRALGAAIHLVAISDAQRSTAPDLPWAATVHNAIRTAAFPYLADKQDYALFLGRFHPEKAPHVAIDAARAAGMPIVLAGKCSEPIEQAYFSREIEPRAGPGVTILGVADATAKRALLANAACLLFPIAWDEPFGLVIIEAMACGTPVVALRRGAVPELVVHGKTGIIVDDQADLPGGIAQARLLDPASCRKHVETRFTVEMMAASYEAAYRQALACEAPALALARRPAQTASAAWQTLTSGRTSHSRQPLLADRPGPGGTSAVSRSALPKQ